MEKKLHVAMFPWLAMGHITPFFHLANELASRGHSVSILSPARAQARLQHLLSLHPTLVTVHTLTVPAVHGLPAGAETTADIDPSSIFHLATAFDLTRHRVLDFLTATRPDLVLYDLAHWLPPMAHDLGIVSLCYIIYSAAATAFSIFLDTGGGGYPSSLVVLRNGAEAETVSFFSEQFGGDGVSFQQRHRLMHTRCDALCVRTCRELDGRFCDYIREQYRKPVLLTGPVLSAADSGPKVLETRWARWLDSFEPGSVVYCSFGSEWSLEKAQFQQVLLGFEETGYNFLISLKPPAGCATVEEAFPSGFGDRVKDHGVVYGGWVQQPLILSHPSVGCFVSHCGFGSVWESLMSECQIVLVPHMYEQILNARLLSEELKVAVEVERDQNLRFSKEGLCGAIKSVMERDSEVGILVKRNHAKLRQVLTEPGFTTGYIDDFVLKLQDLVTHYKSQVN